MLQNRNPRRPKLSQQTLRLARIYSMQSGTISTLGCSSLKLLDTRDCYLEINKLYNFLNEFCTECRSYNYGCKMCCLNGFHLRNMPQFVLAVGNLFSLWIWWNYFGSIILFSDGFKHILVIAANSLISKSFLPNIKRRKLFTFSWDFMSKLSRLFHAVKLHFHSTNIANVNRRKIHYLNILIHSTSQSSIQKQLWS